MPPSLNVQKSAVKTAKVRKPKPPGCRLANKARRRCSTSRNCRKDVQAKLDLMEARAERKADADQRKALAAPASVETGTAVAVADAFKPASNPRPA